MFCLGECSSICLRLPRAGWSRTELRSDCLRNHYARGGEDGHPTIHLLAKGQLAWVFLRALISSPKLGCPVSPGVARSVSSQARLSHNCCALWTVAFRTPLKKRNLTIVLHQGGELWSVDKSSKRLTWPPEQPSFRLRWTHILPEDAHARRSLWYVLGFLFVNECRQDFLLGSSVNFKRRKL